MKAMLNNLIKQLEFLEEWFNDNFGWFFTNGNKA